MICTRCGAEWWPEAQPDVEWVLESAHGQALVVVGPQHECWQHEEWD